jgi:cytochrome c biogenesis protein
MTRLTALLRGSWRQLTTMRTALVLLFLLALAAIPGSLLPQRNVSIENVNRWSDAYPGLAPVVDRLGGFNVYGSPWFSAIYLLLFVSLLGCVIPRLRDHLRALRRPPVDAPQRLSRLPHHATGRRVGGDPSAVARVLHTGLRARHWRSVVREQPDGPVTVSAEKGYLKETGNLLMHFAMVAVLAGVALGAGYGWHGNRAVVAGPDSGFCSVLQQYDEFGLGSRMDDSADLGGFCFELTGFEADFTEAGQPTRFLAHARISRPGHAPRPVDFTVNAPLRLGGADVYLLGHGYAPVLRYTDRFGAVQTETAPFLPADPRGTAPGLVLFPDANVDPAGQRDPALQVAFEGMYLPTAPTDLDTLHRLLAAGISPTSAHPGERAPALALLPYRGDLGIDRDVRRPVLTLDRDQLDSGALQQVGEARFLRPGETMTLDDGTTVEFLGTRPWISLSVRHDPGEPVVLVGVGLLLAGLVASLTGRRRRIWFRIAPEAAASGPAPARSLVEAGGLPRSDQPGFADEFARLVALLPPEVVDAPQPATRRT